MQYADIPHWTVSSVKHFPLNITPTIIVPSVVNVVKGIFTPWLTVIRICVDSGVHQPLCVL